MADSLRVYSPEKVKANWDGLFPLKHFAEGTSITATRNLDNTQVDEGMQGDIGITFNASRSGQLSMVFQQTSETNVFLAAIQNLQDTSGELIRGDITISDPSGSMICQANRVHIMKAPDVSLGDSQEPKTWNFFVEELIYLDLPAGLQGGAALVAVAKSKADAALVRSQLLQNI